MYLRHMLAFLLIAAPLPVVAQVLDQTDLPVPQSSSNDLQTTSEPSDALPAQPEATADDEPRELAGEPIQRGPIHEAFAEPFQLNPTPTPARTQAPPPAVEEIPPDADPDAKNLQWIPGYWAWDEQRGSYIWVSGVWRKIPHGREWVPGEWEVVEGGHRWVPGFWRKTGDGENPVQVQTPPPDSLEEGPTSPAPSENHFWIPGAWRLNGAGEYVWRPGFWAQSQANWVWIPEHYTWQPGGCVYIPGYWDYTWERRGTLYAPCTFSNVTWTGRYTYRPSYVLSSPLWLAHLWIGPGSFSYYYGNYGDYLSFGYSPWYRYYGSHARYYDPLYAYYRWRFPSAYGFGLYTYLDGVYGLYGRSRWPSVSLYNSRDWNRSRAGKHYSVYGNVASLYRQIDPGGTLRYRAGRPSIGARSERGLSGNLGGVRIRNDGRDSGLDEFRNRLGVDAERRLGRLRQDSLSFPNQQRGLRSSPSGPSGPSMRSRRNSNSPAIGSFRNLPSRTPNATSPGGFRNRSSLGPGSSASPGSFRNRSSLGPGSSASPGSFRNRSSRGPSSSASPGGFRNLPSRNSGGGGRGGVGHPSPGRGRNASASGARKFPAIDSRSLVTGVNRPNRLERSVAPSQAVKSGLAPSQSHTTPSIGGRARKASSAGDFAARGKKAVRGTGHPQQREVMKKNNAGRKK